MKVYIAARYKKRMELLQFSHKLEARGHIITSRWLQGKHDHEEDVVCAKHDFEDVKECDVIISFTEEPRTATRGGRHVELGLALAWGKTCIVVGPREHVFHSLRGIIHATKDQLVETIGQLEAVKTAKAHNFANA